MILYSKLLKLLYPCTTAYGFAIPPIIYTILYIIYSVSVSAWIKYIVITIFAFHYQFCWQML